MRHSKTIPCPRRLGQKQTVDFTLNIASASATVLVQEQAPLVNPENPNTSTTLNARALEDLPNPGGDMTYPLQFAAGRAHQHGGQRERFRRRHERLRQRAVQRLAVALERLHRRWPGNQRSADESEQRPLDQSGAGTEFDRGGDGQHAFLRGGSGPIRRFAGELRHQIRHQSSFTEICTSCGTDRSSMRRISSPTPRPEITSRARR